MLVMVSCLFNRDDLTVRGSARGAYNQAGFSCGNLSAMVREWVRQELH